MPQTSRSAWVLGIRTYYGISGARASIHVERLHWVIDAGVHWCGFVIYIDDHKLWIYAADGQFHDVQQVDVITVPPGERFSAMIKLNQESDFAIRASASNTPQLIFGYGVISYNPTETSSHHIPVMRTPAPEYGGDTRQGFTELYSMTLKAYLSTLVPPQTADKTTFLELYSLEWSMNTNLFAPFLKLADVLMFNPSNAQQLDQTLVPNYLLGTTVDVIIQLKPSNPKMIQCCQCLFHGPTQIPD
ncbi:hypothetical protein M407DRAFT_25150 [Tulasnella calospora MUT 4182]|uniref:Plastocyanin-like domain-containing protein n=1 Tax=Tulasnella calospora MUT 4182 TaxID=1051891 RepID=A0A0C3KVM6_9AGAM|nr:hypothetical protein M407DRAFT_25150 [Tulasnella calospora MUT 4182]